MHPQINIHEASPPRRTHQHHPQHHPWNPISWDHIHEDLSLSGGIPTCPRVNAWGSGAQQIQQTKQGDWSDSHGFGSPHGDQNDTSEELWKDEEIVRREREGGHRNRINNISEICVREDLRKYGQMPRSRLHNFQPIWNILHAKQRGRNRRFGCQQRTNGKNVSEVNGCHPTNENQTYAQNHQNQSIFGCWPTTITGRYGATHPISFIHRIRHPLRLLHHWPVRVGGQNHAENNQWLQWGCPGVLGWSKGETMMCISIG